MSVVKKPRRGRPTPAQIQERKLRVLQAAETLFIKHGFAGTTVSEIAKQSRVTPRLITAHFGNKALIFAEVIKKKNYEALLLANEQDADTSLEGALFRAAKFAWNTTYSPSAISFLRLLVGEGGRLTDKTAEIAKASSDYFFSHMEAIFADLMRRGLIPESDPPRLAKYFVDLMVGFSLVQAGMGYWDRVSDDDEIRDKIRFFCQGIARPDA